VRLWDPTTGVERKQIRTHEGGPIVNDQRSIGLAVSPDGRRIATVTPSGPARIWELASGRALLTIGSPTKKKPSGVGIAFDGNGERLAFAGDDNQVLIVDTADGKTLATLSGETGEVESIAFAPDGSRISTAGAHRTIRIWDPVRGDELLSLRGHWSEVCGLAWSCDGRYLASVSHDRTVRVWDGGPPEYITIKDRNLVSGVEKENPYEEGRATQFLAPGKGREPEDIFNSVALHLGFTSALWSGSNVSWDAPRGGPGELRP